MKRASASLLAAVLAAGPAPAPAQPADLVVQNARVWTGDAARPWAEALAVIEGRLVLVGGDAEAARWIGGGTRVEDVGGRLLLPGFHDAHAHVLDWGLETFTCPLGHAPTLEATLERIAACMPAQEGRAWFVGTQWNDATVRGPGRAPLDSLLGERPAIVFSGSSHAAWVNTAALRVAGINRETPDPEDGRIGRDPGTGEPDGTLHGEAAMGLVRAHVPAFTEGERRIALGRALAELARVGIVSVQSMEYGRDLPLYDEALRAERLTARVRVAIYHDGEEDVASEIARLAALRHGRDARWLAVGAVKLFVDGDPGGLTGAFLEPYAGAAGSEVGRGPIRYEPEQLDARVGALDRAGWQIHVHAIGDRAIRMALDAFELARAANGPRDIRHTIAHLHFLHPDDRPRLAGLDVAATVTPGFADNGPYNTEVLPRVLGPNRMDRLHAFRSMRDGGARLAIGSDAPVLPFEPFQQVEVAVTRREIGETDGEPMNPSEALTIEEAVAAYTRESARLNHLDDSGTLEVGRWADFVVVDRDVFALPAHAIHRTRVVWTMVEGRETFRALEW